LRWPASEPQPRPDHRAFKPKTRMSAITRRNAHHHPALCRGGRGGLSASDRICRVTASFSRRDGGGIYLRPWRNTHLLRRRPTAPYPSTSMGAGDFLSAQHDLRESVGKRARQAPVRRSKRTRPWLCGRKLTWAGEWGVPLPFSRSRPEWPCQLTARSPQCVCREGWSYVARVDLDWRPLVRVLGEGWASQLGCAVLVYNSIEPDWWEASRWLTRCSHPDLFLTWE